MLAAAARRFVTLLAAVVGGTALLALPLGLLLGGSPSRSVAGSRAPTSSTAEVLPHTSNSSLTPQSRPWLRAEAMR